MKNKVLIIILVFSLLIPIGIASSTYHTSSSSPIVNSNGITSSKSELSSPIGGQISFGKFISLSSSENMFSGCIYDGEKMWLVPYSYGKIIYYSKSGEADSVDFSALESGTALYFGGAFDGKSIYFAPYGAEGILQIDKETKQVEEIKFDKGNNKYKGAYFDGENVWFFPSDGKDIIKLSSVGEVTKYKVPYEIPQTNAFCGGVVVSGKLYLVPDATKEIITLNLSNGEFDKVPIEKTSFSGAVAEGKNIWFLPKSSGCILKFNTESSNIETFELTTKNSNDVFGGGGFDGRNIWLAPSGSDSVVKYDIFRNEFKAFTLEKSNEKFIGGAFDGESVWLSPLSADSPLKIKGDNTPPTVMNIFLETPAGTTLESELVVNDSDEGDKAVFSISQEPQKGTVTLDSESGKFIYTAGSETGEDSFYYYATDLHDDSNIGKVTIKVTPKEEIQTGKYIDLWDHWAEDAAEYLTESKVLLGEEVDGYYYFYPNITMNRANFIVWANSAFGYEGSTSDNTLPFEDIKNAEKWVVNAASAAYQNKLIMGSLEGDKLYFKPYENLSRAEALTIVYNVIKPPLSPETPLDFDDKETFPSWSLDILRALKNAGILKGYEDNTLRLYNSVTRAEAAQILYETLQSLQGNSRISERLK